MERDKRKAYCSYLCLSMDVISMVPKEGMRFGWLPDIFLKVGPVGFSDIE